jgi:hypothetical protein
MMVIAQFLLAALMILVWAKTGKPSAPKQKKRIH